MQCGKANKLTTNRHKFPNGPKHLLLAFNPIWWDHVCVKPISTRIEPLPSKKC